MPDFLLCNSKLTFQMTMTPEKTNYMTQGADGIKRLKQGPDLSSYRGLSVIHSKAFAMEVGQHPRDILRRRVRTAEYYRITPHKENYMREFELYNEERDTWFTLTFQDLLRYAMYQMSTYNPWSHPEMSSVSVGGRYGADNHQKLARAYQSTVKLGSQPDSGELGALVTLGANPLITPDQEDFLKKQAAILTADWEFPLTMLIGTGGDNPLYKEGYALKVGNLEWGHKFNPFNLGVRHIFPRPEKFPLWEEWVNAVPPVMQSKVKDVNQCLICLPRLNSRMMEGLFHNLQHVPLNFPFKADMVGRPMTALWYIAFSFYQEVYKRFGVPVETVQPFTQEPVPTNVPVNAWATRKFRRMVSSSIHVDNVDISCQYLCSRGAVGSVNHWHHFAIAGKPEMNQLKIDGSIGRLLARRFILTFEILEPLLREYDVRGSLMTGIDYIKKGLWYAQLSDETKGQFKDLLRLIQLSCVEGPVQVGTVTMIDELRQFIYKLLSELKVDSVDTATVGYLSKHGVNTWPMGITTMGHVFHRENPLYSENTKHMDLLEPTFGVLNKNFLSAMPVQDNGSPFALDKLGRGDYNIPRTRIDTLGGELDWSDFWDTLNTRLFQDPVHGAAAFTAKVDDEGVDTMFWPYETMGEMSPELIYAMDWTNRVRDPARRVVTSIAPDGALQGVSIDMNELFQGEGDGPRLVVKPMVRRDDIHENVEIVIIRPNIEHNMLGIIMGLAGSELGYTLWGQTELSCYDDSMHGIWGMSYKYHERAIVFNEKNLIRLWDIAYDGYNGGKDDTYVDWLDAERPKYGLNAFRDATLDLGRNYRGPSMMVMAFVHDKKETGQDGRPTFDSHFRRNWPSPIVFHDVHDPVREPMPANETLPLDYDNIQVVDVQDFRVFNSPLYANSYSHYKGMMPAFQELHKMRKTAGQASAESETQTDSLAFQGSMRIKQKGRLIQEIQGSGHHGPDYVGVASVRAGKGIKYNGQAPTLSHMV